MNKQSFRRHEGYFELDHRASPGNAIAPEGTHFESALAICGHCQRGVLINPDRTRERGRCLKCQRYLCDVPGLRGPRGCKGAYETSCGECHDIRRQLDEVHEKLVREQGLVFIGLI